VPTLGEAQVAGIHRVSVPAASGEEDACQEGGETPAGLRDRPSPDTLADMDHRDRLKELLVERSVRLGDFTLASGARSPYYVDARRTTMCAEGQALVGRVGFALLRERALDVTHVGGLTMGADPVAYAIAHRSWLEGHPLDAFSIRKKAKEHGTGQRIEGGVPPGARCVVVEDSMTTGGSALAAVEALRELGAPVVAVLTVVDRMEGGRERLLEHGLPLLSLFTGPELLGAARSRS
jgi:orotate phosphoribosyltransferase